MNILFPHNSQNISSDADLAAHLENPNGTDATSYANNGSPLNGVTTTNSGKISNAYSFDGIDDCISVPDNSSLDIVEQITLSAWIYINSIGDYERIIAKLFLKEYQLKPA